MRPKFVILVLVIAFGLLGVMAVLKGVSQKQPADAHDQTAVPVAAQDSTPAATNPKAAAINSIGNNTALSEEQRAVIINKELEQIHELVGEIDGTNNPVIIAALVEKLNNPEADVRNGVLDALRQLNDTNAVPGMQRIADNMKDPRDKVAVLNAIDFIKLPSILADAPPVYFTNDTGAPLHLRNVKMGAKLSGDMSNRSQNPGATPPVAQPQ